MKQIFIEQLSYIISVLFIFYRKKVRERNHGKKYRTCIYGTMMFVMDKASFSSHKPLNTAQHNFKVFFEIVLLVICTVMPQNVW